MTKSRLLRFAGAAAAAGMLLAQSVLMPAEVFAATNTLTSDSISKCAYVKRFDEPQTVARGEDYKMTLGEIGVPAGAEVTELWLELGFDTSSGLPTMPAFGYSAVGLNEDDWFCDGVWIQSPTATATAILYPNEEYKMPDDFIIQIWGDEGKTLDSYELYAVGVMCGEAGNIGPMTRKGDANDDKTVDVKDAVVLQKYLLRNTEEIAAPGNVDFDRDNRLTAIDLTILKQGLMDGSFESGTVSGETSMEFVKHIRLGWNLGNTFDAQSPDYVKTSGWETSWNNPVTTEQMIVTLKAAGFNTIRIPVAWGQKMDNSTYQIREDWMNRVQEVVDYVIDNDMYCILNIHHDNDKQDKNGRETSYPYFYPDSAHYEKSEKFVTSVWSQVSERFESYSDHLIFETLNEPRLIGHNNEWWIDSNNADCKDAMNCINKLNAAALNTIRKSGGNNASRFVLMPTYAANADASTLAGCVMPDDPHIIAEIHSYSPYNFALNTGEGATAVWNETTDGRQITDVMDRVKAKFIDNGIPVIIDEFGAMNRDNEDARAEWAKFYLNAANVRGIPCVWWDNNAFNSSGENFGLLDRSSCTFAYEKLLAAMIEATEVRANQ